MLKIGDGGGSEVFTTIAEVMDITTGESLRTAETTAHDGTGWAEHIGTILEGGEITFSLNFNAAATQGFATGLRADMVARTKRNFQLLIPTTVNKTGSFAALVTAFPLNLPVDGALTADVTLLVTSTVTWA